MGKRKEKRGLLSRYSGYIGLIILLAVLAVTNPSRNTHREALEAKAGNQGSEVSAVINGALTQGTLAYKNYFICSVTTAEGKRLTFGILGTVSVVLRQRK